jgi:hypothetical protein
MEDPGPLVLVFFVGLFIGLPLTVIAVLVALIIRKSRPHRDEGDWDDPVPPSGFEVRLNSGGKPETKKKENDHG